ncbi:hypothetical protein SSAG_03995 [Streptomyces sp. Mg1]|nr:hypothetical protein SSAG_03995 [Streptomyces sp. Mg1]
MPLCHRTTVGPPSGADGPTGRELTPGQDPPRYGSVPAAGARTRVRSGAGNRRPGRSAGRPGPARPAMRVTGMYERVRGRNGSPARGVLMIRNARSYRLVRSGRTPNRY